MKISFLITYLFRLSLTCLFFKYSNGLTWNQFMNTAMWGTREISETFEPYVVENFPASNVSKQCTDSLITYAEGIKHFEPWAIKMFDATGKPPSSFLRGTYTDFGSFDECLSLKVAGNGPFKGRFCMLSLTSPLFPPIKLDRADKDSYIKTYGDPPYWARETTQFLENDWPQFFGLYLGICIPSTCSETDLTNIISAYTKPAEIQMSLLDCQVKESSKWTTGGKVAIIIVTCLFVIIITGTTLDFYGRKVKQNNVSCHKEGTQQNFFNAFSLITNFEILLKKPSKTNSLDFINGMKFWNVIWILILHLFAIETLWEFKRHRNMHHFTRIRTLFTIMFENSLPSSTYFIFLNGFLATYSLKNKKVHTRQRTEKRNISPLKLFLIRYLRLMPSIVFLLLMTFVVPLTYNGPIWNSTWNNVQNKFLKHGWTIFLSVSTLFDYESHCWIHMWLYSTLMQFQIISIPLLSMAKRRPKLTLIIGCLVILGCGVRDVVVSVQNEYKFPSIQSMQSLIYFKDYFSKIYCKPFNHFSSFTIGMLFGWIDLKAFKMNRISLVIGWVFYVLLSLALYYVVMCPMQNLILIAFHNAFRGIFFSLQMGWLMYTCLNGKAGIIGKIFSWKVLIPFGKLLNSVIMFHPLLIVTYEAMRREKFYTTSLNYARLHLALIIYSFVFSAITFLVVESPFNRLSDMWEGNSSESARACSENKSSIAQHNGLASGNNEKINNTLPLKRTLAEKKYIHLE